MVLAAILNFLKTLFRGFKCWNFLILNLINNVCVFDRIIPSRENNYRHIFEKDNNGFRLAIKGSLLHSLTECQIQP